MSKELELRSFMIYTTDSLRMIPQMMYMKERWIDLIGRPRERKPEQTADEIIDHVASLLEE